MAFIDLLQSPLQFKAFLFWKLPSAFFSGVRLRSVDEEQCTVSVPYKWFSQNPFRSTYFACLAMAAEMSTGLLAMLNTHGRKPEVSMLVQNLEAEYVKKATGRTLFTCRDGAALRETVERAVSTGEAQTLRTRSVGVNDQGETIAIFHITWSFKQKRSS